MERLTAKNDGGEYFLKSELDMESAIKKLALFEEMYESLLNEQQKLVSNMEKMKLEGKNNTVTYKQIMANKLMNMNLIGRFEVYGLK